MDNEIHKIKDPKKKKELPAKCFKTIIDIREPKQNCKVTKSIHYYLI